MNRRSQNDVRSFYDNLIDTLGELCKLYNCNPFIDDYLKGEIITITKREKCEHIGINRQPMYCIDVPIESIYIIIIIIILFCFKNFHHWKKH